MLSSHVYLSPFVAALKDVSLLKFSTSGVNALNILQIFLSEQGHHTGMQGIIQAIKLRRMKGVYM
jgi:hypothetical protein